MGEVGFGGNITASGNGPGGHQQRSPVFWRQYGKKGHALNRRIRISVHFQQAHLAWCVV